MTKIFLIAAIAAMLPFASHALIKANDDNLGAVCFDDDNSYRLIKCVSPGALANFNSYYCSNDYKWTVADNSFVGGLHCIAGVDSGGATYSKNFYVCTMEHEQEHIGNVCLEVQRAAFKDANPYEFDWIDSGVGRTYRDVYSCSEGTDSARYIHELTCSKGQEYVCYSGYYKSGGAGSSTTCAKCPENGTTPDYNTLDITGCYMPVGRSFSDETGSGTYTGACYYRN